jgi:hypothetical protein
MSRWLAAVRDPARSSGGRPPTPQLSICRSPLVASARRPSEGKPSPGHRARRPGERVRIDSRPACGLAAASCPPDYSPQWKEPHPPQGAPPVLRSVAFLHSSCSRLVTAGRVRGPTRSLRTSQRSVARLIVAGAARRQGTRRFRSKRPPSRRLSPLTARLVARPHWRAVPERRGGRLTSFKPSDRMPICLNCGHGGSSHNWQRRTHWGHCMFPKCDCRKYVPRTDKPRPVNSVIGRMLRAKRR